jgi:DNA-binding transcriptional LysR family regulator
MDSEYPERKAAKNIPSIASTFRSTERLNLRQVQAFRAVILTGTTLKAGELMHISQPAVSRLIAELESAAGYALFERKRGRLVPTRQAEALLTEVDKVFASLERVEQLLHSRGAAEAVHLRIVATTPMAHGRRLPHVSVSLKVVVRRELRAQLDEQLFDIALSSYPLDYPDDATELIKCVESVCVVPHGHHLATRKVVTPVDLLEEHFIAMPLESGARQKNDAVFRSMGKRIRLMSEAQNGTIICQLVAAGMGVALVDPFSASVFATQLVQLPFQPAIEHQFRFFFPLQRPRLPMAMILAEITRSLCNHPA